MTDSPLCGCGITCSITASCWTIQLAYLLGCCYKRYSGGHSHMPWLCARIPAQCAQRLELLVRRHMHLNFRSILAGTWRAGWHKVIRGVWFVKSLKTTVRPMWVPFADHCTLSVMTPDCSFLAGFPPFSLYFFLSASSSLLPSLTPSFLPFIFSFFFHETRSCYRTPPGTRPDRSQTPVNPPASDSQVSVGITDGCHHARLRVSSL